MTKPFTGGCACGAIRYSVSGDPIVMNDCQCRHCQQRSGAGHGSYVTFSGAAVTVSGQPSRWEITGDLGTVKAHAFCPTCGTPTHIDFPAMPEIFVIHAGSLDEPERYQPNLTLFTASGQAWDAVAPGMTTFEKMPG